MVQFLDFSLWELRCAKLNIHSGHSRTCARLLNLVLLRHVGTCSGTPILRVPFLGKQGLWGSRVQIHKVRL